MPTPQVTVADPAQATEVVEGMARVRAELGVADGFPAEVLAAAEAAARSTARTSGRPDRTDIALVTIDPPGSRDLDQAYGAERRPGGGYRIWYAIADVAAFNHDKAEVQLREPAVVARARNGRDCEPGDEVEVVLRAADPLTRRVDLDVV